MTTPARGYSWPPFQPGHRLSVKHGAQSRRVIDARAEVVRVELLEQLPWSAEPRFALAVDLAAEQVARAQLAHEAYLMTPGARNLEAATAASHRAMRSLEELGGTPAGFAKLKILAAGGEQAEASLADVMADGARSMRARGLLEPSQPAQEVLEVPEAIDVANEMGDDSDA